MLCSSAARSGLAERQALFDAVCGLKEVMEGCRVLRAGDIVLCALLEVQGADTVRAAIEEVTEG